MKYKTNGKVVEIFYEHGIKYPADHLRDIITREGLLMPQSYNGVEKNINCLVKRYRDLNKSKSKSPGKEILESFLHSTYIFPMPKYTHETPYS